LGTWWEIKHPPLQKHNKHVLGACVCHPIGSPLQKNEKQPWGHVGAIQLALLTCFILTSGCLWPKATVKSPVGARDLRPLWSFISFIFSYLLLFIWPLPCPPCPAVW